MSDELQPGDWVTVYAQVVDEPTKPEDIVVEMFSSNTQFMAHVLRDRVSKADPPARIALRCSSLYWTDTNGLQHCVKHDGHSGHHVDDLEEWYYRWTDADEYGRVER